MENPQNILENNLIILKPFELKDTETHLAGDDAEQIKWLNEGNKSTIESVKNWIIRNQKNWEENGPVFNFAIWSKENGKLVGMVEANTDYEKFEGLQNGDANISYSVYPTERGKGYAKMAVDLITNFLKEKQLTRATLRISPDNTKSLKIPTTCGFQDPYEIETKGGKMLLFVKNLR